MCESITSSASMVVEASIAAQPRILTTTASDALATIEMIDDITNAPLGAGTGNGFGVNVTSTGASGPLSQVVLNSNNSNVFNNIFQWGAASSVVVPMVPFSYGGIQVFNSTTMFGLVGTASNKPQWYDPWTSNTGTLDGTLHYICFAGRNSLATAPGNGVMQASWVRFRTGTSELN
jgi:hypothetical protein